VLCKALFNHGSHAVLISEEFTDCLGIRQCKLPQPECINMAMGNKTKEQEYMLHDWIKLRLHDPVFRWTAHTVHTIVAPGLCTPVILGLLFLVHNTIVVDHAARTAVDKHTGFDLLHPTPPAPCRPTFNARNFT